MAIANKKTRKLFTFIVSLSTSGIISRLWWGISRLVVDWLLVGAHVVDVVVVLPVSSVFVRPLQLGLECVVLLAEVLFPVVCRDIDVLEVVVPGVTAIGTRSGYGKGSSRALWSGES